MASVLIHVGLVGTAVRVGLPETDFRADVIAAELVDPAPPAPPPPAQPVTPPPPKPRPAPPASVPKLIEAPAPKLEERVVQAPPPPSPPPPAPPAVAAKRDEAPAAPPPASPAPHTSTPEPRPQNALPSGASAITTEPPAAAAPPGPPSATAPATPGPTASIAPDAVTRTAIPRGGYQVRPSYPSNVRRLGVEGTTKLRVHVTADGRVGDVVVETSAGHADLDQAAVDAVRRWRFEPARRGTEAVPMWVRLPVEFRLR